MSEQPYEIGKDLGDDPQLSWAAMYEDVFPQRHLIAEIDDEIPRGISRWVREEDSRESDTFIDPMDDPPNVDFEG
ncbi:hypothetical protein ACQEUU_31490 [Nonomuraea sp. CA-218870]|uniref:hypothetical protein n=1 Tax=Nonomuraea sp. CA-218870 TaxID=3239998 RepID=UPI003D8D70A0